MRYRLPLSTSRARGLLAALAIVFTITSAALAQFGGFDPSFDGELWTVRHQLTIADDGVPAGLAFSGGTLFVADSAHHSIVGYNTAGAIVSQWDLTASPASDLVPNQLTATVINVDGADRDALLLSDRESNRVAAFAAADGTYLFTLRLARPANEPTYALSTGQTALSAGAKFNFTSSPPALTLTGNFAAAWREQWLTGPVDSGVLAFDGAASVFQLDGSEFVGTASIVLNGTEGNPVAPAPQNFFGVTFDTAGNLYALDAFTERLHVYSAAFTRLFTFGTPVAGGGTAEFYEPWGLAFWPDASGS
ncbi:MAG TPA: hypothetical protein VFZ31_06630, partial [Vicinamibacterales bacterium]